MEKEVRDGIVPATTSVPHAMNYYTGFADLNSDGFKDLIVGGCYKTTAAPLDGCDQKYRYFENEAPSNDGQKSATEPTYQRVVHQATPLDHLHLLAYDAMAFADIDSDGDVDMLVTSKNSNASTKSLHLYKNTASLGAIASFVRMTNTDETSESYDPFSTVVGLDSPIAAFGDCDSDGDPDLVIGLRTGPQKMLYYENTGGAGSVFQFQQLTAPRPFELPIPYPGNPFFGFNDLGTIGSHAPTLGDVDNDGDVDVIIGVAGEISASGLGKQRLMYLENTGSAINPTFTYRQNSADIFYGFEEIVAQDAGSNSDILLSNPKPNLVDFDADGDLDLLVGTTGGLLYFEFDVGTDVYEVGAGTVNDLLYESTQNVNPFADLSIAAMHDSVSGNQFATVAFVDMDNDGDLDAVVASKDRVTFLNNTGTKSAPVYTMVPGFFPWADCYYCTVAAGDINGDGRPDVIIGTANDHRNGTVTPMKLLYFKNIGTIFSPRFRANFDAINPLSAINAADEGRTTKFIGATWFPQFGPFRLFPRLVDCDGDGQLDLVIGDFSKETTKVIWYKNDRAKNASHTPSFLLASKTTLVSKTGNDVWVNVGSALLPTVADFDGDGSLELLVTFFTRYSVFEFEFEVYRGNFTNGNMTQSTSFEKNSIPRLKKTDQAIHPSDPNATNARRAAVYDYSFSPLVPQAFASPALVDLNNDGSVDLVTVDHLGDFKFFQKGTCVQVTSCSANGKCQNINGQAKCTCSASGGGQMCEFCKKGMREDFRSGGDTLTFVSRVSCNKVNNMHVVSGVLVFVCFVVSKEL